MFGSGRAWLRWSAVAIATVGLVRLGLYVLLPVIPQPFAWGSSILLGMALVFLLLPLPHEALLVHRPPSEQRSDHPAER